MLLATAPLRAGWLCAIAFLSFASLTSAQTSAKGLIIYKKAAAFEDRLAMGVEFSSIEEHTQVVNFRQPGTFKDLRLMREQVVHILRYPNLETGTFTEPAQFADLKRVADTYEAYADKYPQVKALLTPKAQQLRTRAQLFEGGNVMVQGRLMSRKQYESMSQTAGAIPELKVTKSTGEATTLKNVRLSRVDGSVAHVIHDSGTATLSYDQLPANLRTEWKVTPPEMRTPDTGTGEPTETVGAGDMNDRIVPKEMAPQNEAPEKLPPSPDRKALIVGNANYEFARPLVNPPNDAQLLEQRLTELGFAVTKVTDVSVDAMRRSFETFAASLDEKDISVFFFAGHGIQIGGSNYLMGVDSTGDSPQTMIQGSLPLADILQQLGNAKTDINLVILDSCRDNPFGGDGSSQAGALAAVTTIPKRTYVAFATAAGQYALDGSGVNSPFTEALGTSLSARPPSGLTLRDALFNTGVLVGQRTHSQQSPALYLDTSLKPYFLTKAGAVSTTGVTPFISDTGEYQYTGAMQVMRVPWQIADSIPAQVLEEVEFSVQNVVRKESEVAVTLSVKVPEDGQFYLYDYQGVAPDGTLYNKGKASAAEVPNAEGYGWKAVEKPSGENLDVKVKSNQARNITLTFTDVPETLAGFTRLDLACQVRWNKQVTCTFRNLAFSDSIQTEDTQFTTLPLSRKGSFGSVAYGIRELENLGNGKVRAKLVFTASKPGDFTISNVRAFDEYGSFYPEHQIEWGNIEFDAKGAGSYRKHIRLLENQPHEVTVELAGLPNRLGGLTLLEVSGAFEKEDFQYLFYDLTLEPSRGKDIGEPILKLAWQPPQTSKPEMAGGALFGLRNHAVTGNQARLDFIVAAPRSSELRLTGLQAFSPNGGLFNTAKFLIGSNDITANRFTAGFQLPAGQPVLVSALIDGVPEYVQGFTEVQINGDFAGQSASPRWKNLPLRSTAPIDSDGAFVWTAPEPWGQSDSIGVVGGIQEVRHTGNKGYVSIILRSPNQDRAITLHRFRAIDQTGAVYQAGKKVVGESKLENTHFYPLEVNLPARQPRLIDLEIDEVSENLKGFALVELYGVAGNNEVRFAFHNVPMGLSMLPQADPGTPAEDPGKSRFDGLFGGGSGSQNSTDTKAVGAPEFRATPPQPKSQARVQGAPLSFGYIGVSGSGKGTTARVLVARSARGETHIRKAEIATAGGAFFKASSGSVAGTGQNNSMFVGSKVDLPKDVPVALDFDFPQLEPSATQGGHLRITGYEGNQEYTVTLPLD